MRVEEHIGQRVRARRAELGLTADEFGRQLEPLLGKKWSRQTVSMAEQGSRAWVAADLLAVAKVLQTTVSELFRPAIDAAAVDLGGPNVLPRDEVFDLIWVRSREDLNLAAIHQTITRMADAAGQNENAGRQQRELARELDELIIGRVAGGGAVSLPSAEPGADPVPLPHRHSSGREGET